MALNWQFKDGVVEKMTDEEKAENDIYIWGCLQVSLKEINEKNVDEWHWRYAFTTALNGPAYFRNNEPLVPTLAEIKKRIGLWTNCTEMTRLQFVHRVVKNFTV